MLGSFNKNIRKTRTQIWENIPHTHARTHTYRERQRERNRERGREREGGENNYALNIKLSKTGYIFKHIHRKDSVRIHLYVYLRGKYADTHLRNSHKTYDFVCQRFLYFIFFIFNLKFSLNIVYLIRIIIKARQAI